MFIRNKLFFLCFLCNLLDTAMYHNNIEWSFFKEANPYRSALSDLKDAPEDTSGWPNYEENQELYEELDISKNDYLLFSSSNYADERVLNIDNLKSLVDSKEGWVFDAAHFHIMVGTLARGLLSYDIAIPLLILFGVNVLLLIVTKNWCSFLLVFYECGVFALLECYFFVRGRYLQRRVDIIMLAAIYLIMMLYCWRTMTLHRGKRPFSYVVAILVFSFALNFGNLCQDREYKEKQEILMNRQAEARQLIAEDTEHFYFYPNMWNSYPDKIFSIWQRMPENHYQNSSHIGVWPCTTPIIWEQWAGYGITNPYEDLVGNEKVYFFSIPKSKAARRALKLIRSHYAPDAQMHLVKLLEGNYAVFRFTTGDGPSLANLSIRPADEEIFSSLSAKPTKDGTILSGFAWKKNVSSFASTIYVGVTDENGKETLYYVTQSRNYDCNDDHYGRYSAFTMLLPKGINAASYQLYLETEDGVYRCDGNSDWRIP